MIRKIINIDSEKCNGCGACAKACHEGAIGMVNGKAVLLRDDYCDGLGDCLPTCPTNAISFIEREALPYDEEAVKKNMENKKRNFVCSSSSEKVFNNEKESMLRQWPVQIKLVPVNAAYFKNADLLIAADCTAYAYGNFHKEFMKNKITLIGCPKLDFVDYSEKLTEIIKNNDIKSLTVTRMEVPCCGGIENAVKKAIINSGKNIPLNIIIISTEGKILS
ncbi:MAG: ATP-binding protein [Lachnospirales bacterium]